MPEHDRSLDGSVASSVSHDAGSEPVAEHFALVYDELRGLARRHLRREPSGHTLTTTDLVHSAYLQLAEQTRAQWQGEAHFMAVAAMAMRRILVDHARSRRSVKRGGRLQRVPLVSADAMVEERADLVIALDEALARLRMLDTRQAQVVECRFFGGMSEAQVAEALGITDRTVRRDWVKARDWLYVEIYGDQG